MNNTNRIQQLKARAGIHNNPDQEGLSLFADLILRECLYICENLGNKGMDGHYCVDKIRKEFGL